MNASSPKDYSSNIPKLLGLNFFWSAFVIMPVIIPFFESKGLNMEQVFQLQSIFAIGTLILELPSGYISDLWTRKTALLVACFFQGLGFSLFVVSDNFLHLAVAEVVLALGVSLLSGTDVSFLYDSLLASGKKVAPIKFVGRKVFYRQLGEALGGLVGGWLILISMESVVWVQAIVSWIPLLVVLGLDEPPRKKMDKRKHKENFIYVFQSLFRHSRLLTLVILNFMFFSLSSLIAAWMLQKHWETIHIPIIYWGYLWFLTNLAVAATGRYAHKIEKHIGSTAVLLIIGVLPIASYLGMGFVESIWGVVFCLGFQITRGLTTVVLVDALNRRVTSDMRATANSVAGLGMRTLFIVLGPAAGYAIDQWGIFTTSKLLGGVYIVIFIFIMIPFLMQRKNFAPIGK